MSDDELMSVHSFGHSPRPGEGGLEDEDRYEVFMPAVQRLVNALGGFERVPQRDGGWTTIYRPGDSVLPVIKDLKKLWRKDDSDDERTVARCMYQANLMKELIGLVSEVADRGAWGRKVALMACDLIAALTWPIDVAAELKEMADEGPVVTDYATLLRAQVEYKAQILQSGVLKHVLTLMLPCFAKERDDKDDRIISLCLHIVRNLLSIRDVRAPDTATGEEEELSRLQSTLIAQLNKLAFLDLFLTMGSNADKATGFNSYNMLLLDVLHLIYRCIRPEELARDQSKSSSEKLAKLLAEEAREKTLSHVGKATRHSRFGTTLQVRTSEQRVILHSQAAITADATAVLDATKKRKAPNKKRLQDELLLDTTLTSEAIVVLQKFTKDFLESSFNTFIASVLADIRMERAKVRDTDNVRTLFVISVFVEYLLILRRLTLAKLEEAAKTKDDRRAIKQRLDEELPLGWAVETVDEYPLRWISAQMRLAMDEKPPAWTALQAAIVCFTQILLYLEALTGSTDKEDVEAANQLQSMLYYDSAILDASIAVISDFKTQSYSYLEAVITFGYTLFRNLERYSKSQAYMFVRKRKPKRKKIPRRRGSGEAPIPEEYGNDEEEGMSDDEREKPEYAEHKFTFTSFEKRLAQESVTRTLLAYLAQYKTFTTALPFKRVVGLMYRQVVKAQAEGLYFNVSTLNLFRRVLDDKPSLPYGDGTRDLWNLLQFILRKFFKRMAEDPFLMIEAFLPRSREQWKSVSSYVDEDDDGMGAERARVREQMGPPELEFIKKNKLSWSDQMAVAIRFLLDADHEEWVRWVITVLEIALAFRNEVVFAVDGDVALVSHDSDDEDVIRNLSGPSKDAQEKFTPHDLSPNTEERQNAVSQDQHLRLMLKLVSFEQSDEENAAERRWFLPATVMPDSIKASIGALEQYLINPPTLDQDPKTLVRPVRRRRAKSPLLNEDGEVIAPPPRPRKRKEKDELQVYKSAAYIDDSDDDEDADNAFFAREADLRKEMNAFAEASGSAMRRSGTKKRKRTKNKGIEPLPLADMDVNAMEEDEDEDEDESDGDKEESEEDQPRRRSRSVVPSDSDDEAVVAKRARATLSPMSVASDTVTQTQGRRRRAVFDSDDE